MPKNPTPKTTSKTNPKTVSEDKIKKDLKMNLETNLESNLETKQELSPKEIEDAMEVFADTLEGALEPAFFIGLNWKSNPESWTQAGDILNQYGQIYTEVFGDLTEEDDDFTSYLDALEISVMPPSIYLSNLIEVAEDNDLPVVFSFGMQDIGAGGIGAFTGQIAGEMGANLGVSEVLIGHSETRNSKTGLGYTNQDVAQKVRKALENDLQPIIAVGHSYGGNDKQEINLTEILEQTKTAVLVYKDFPDTLADIIIAYEPVWAIGSGKTPTNQQLEEVFEAIMTVVEDLDLDLNLRMIYGGSVDEKNTSNLLTVKGLGGFLIGGVSLKPEKLKGVLTAVKEIFEIVEIDQDIEIEDELEQEEEIIES